VTGAAHEKRLDDVEIKISMSEDQVEDAVRILGLPADRPRWQIYFCEDVAAGVSPGTPLLDAHVVLRARVKSQGKADSTVKLRPCRRSQLPDRWLAAHEEDDCEVKVEADWAGARRVLAASCTADRPDSLVGEVARGQRRIEDLFVARQADFLRDCAGIHVNLGTLTVLPPVTATRWGSVDVSPLDLEVRAERWTVGNLDFLEISVVAAIGEAPATQEALTEHLTSRGLAAPTNQESKTSQVMELLVRQALRGGG
jgi:hypothetical protein